MDKKASLEKAQRSLGSAAGIYQIMDNRVSISKKGGDSSSLGPAPPAGNEIRVPTDESRTGKSRTDRHRIPYIPIEYHFYRKIRNSEKIRENPVNSETKSGEAFS